MEDSSRQFSSRRRTLRRGHLEISGDRMEIWRSRKKPWSGRPLLHTSGWESQERRLQYLVLVQVDLYGLQLCHLHGHIVDLVAGQVQQVQVPQGAQSRWEFRNLVARQAERAQSFELAQTRRQHLDPVPIQTQSLQFLQLGDLWRQTCWTHTHSRCVPTNTAPWTHFRASDQDQLGLTGPKLVPPLTQSVAVDAETLELQELSHSSWKNLDLVPRQVHRPQVGRQPLQLLRELKQAQVLVSAGTEQEP